MLLFFVTNRFFAQEIIIQPPMFTPFECTDFYKLYTGTVMNFSGEPFNTRLVLEVDYTTPAGNAFRLADGILKGIPATVFDPGTTIIDNTSYERIYSDRQITFYNKDIENLLSTTKCLPPGTYDICLTLYDINNTDPNAEFLTQTCYTREKIMFSPLLLVSPFEEEEIQIDLPLFTWTAVTPFNPRAMYRIQIVEILANQTPFEASRSNPIFFQQTGLMSNIFQYPISARTMLPCTEYVWNVTYELQGGFSSMAFQRVPDFLQQSEFWTFRTACEEEEEQISEGEEGILKEYFKTGIYQVKTYEYTGNKLRFEIDNPYGSGTGIDYIIEDEHGELLNTKCCDIIIDQCDTCEKESVTLKENDGLSNGKNLLRIETDDIGLSEGRYYTMRLMGLKEALIIKFKYLGDEE